MDPAVAALAGAAVGLAGAWLLERRRNRREDLATIRARLGAASAVGAELVEANSSLGVDLGRGVLGPQSAFSAVLWQAHAATVLPLVSDEEAISLTRAHSALTLTNRLIEAIRDVQGRQELPLKPGTDIHNGLTTTKENVHAAAAVMRGLIASQREELRRAQRGPLERLADAVRRLGLSRS